MPNPFADLRVLIVGDVMLDEYWFGDVKRISPEAPVPIVKIEQVDERPGGAANVARNVVALGGKATLLSVVGRDGTAERLRQVLDDAGIDHALQEDETIRTTLKLRVIGQQQQMLRVDFEGAPSSHSLDAKQAEFERRLDDCDAVIFSDYRKGALQRVSDLLRTARSHDRLSVVDPKGRNYRRYIGADVITPNRSELADEAGPWDEERDMDDKAEGLRSSLGLEALLLTMSEQGMKLYRDGAQLHRAAKAREVFDVSGAGDTVVAAVTVMRAIGASWEDTIDFANAAAGVVVSRLGTSVATYDEVQAALAEADSNAGQA